MGKTRIGHAALAHFKASSLVGPAVLAVAIGACAGLASAAFRDLIAFMNTFFFEGLGGTLEGGMGPAVPIVVLATGGLVVGLITKYFAPETKGHGVPEVMLAVAHFGGRIRPRVALFKALAAAVCIGSGGSAGREGPIVQIGSALGSALGQWFKLPDRRVTLCVACGAAGGIAATFNAPMAGVLFALEVILARFTSMSFGVVVLSSATATVVHQAVTGDTSPAFAIPTDFTLTSGWELLLFALMGVAAAFVAQLYTRSLYAVEDATDRVKIPDFVKPAIGGALVGAIGMYDSRIFATGYHTIERALAGELTLQILAILCLLKIVATSLTIGSGGSGGVFAPSLFVGAMFGGAFGTIAHQIFPGFTSASGAYALVGMAAVFAGSARAPMTAVFILFEMTDDYHIILPLMTATVISTVLSQRIAADSIYTVKLRRRGINISAVQDVNLMDAITVREAMEKDFESVPPTMPLTALIMKFATSSLLAYPVIDEEGALCGIVTKSDVERANIDGNPHLMRVEGVCTDHVIVSRPEQSLGTALNLFASHDIGRLPVVDPNNPGRVIGMLHRASIVTAYANAYRHTQESMHQADKISALSEPSETVLVEQALTSRSTLTGKVVMDAGFPAGSTLAAVRRGNETIIPRGSTELELGDTLVVLSTRRESTQVKRWLKEQC
jgi:CIC family chloride channel protein